MTDTFTFFFSLQRGNIFWAAKQYCDENTPGSFKTNGVEGANAVGCIENKT